MSRVESEPPLTVLGITVVFTVLSQVTKQFYSLNETLSISEAFLLKQMCKQT